VINIDGWIEDKVSREQNARCSTGLGTDKKGGGNLRTQTNPLIRTSLMQGDRSIQGLPVRGGRGNEKGNDCLKSTWLERKGTCVNRKRTRKDKLLPAISSQKKRPGRP